MPSHSVTHFFCDYLRAAEIWTEKKTIYEFIRTVSKRQTVNDKTGKTHHYSQKHDNSCFKGQMSHRLPWHYACRKIKIIIDKESQE